MNRELLDRNFVVATALATYRNINILFFVVLAIIAIEIAGNLAENSSSFVVASTLTWCYLAFAAHAAVLKNLSGLESISSNNLVWKFFGRTFLLSLLPILVAVLLGLALPAEERENAAERLILTMLILALPLFLITFSLFGTVLPAIVVEGNRSIARAIRRGFKTFFFTAGRLIIGPGVILALMFWFALAYPYSDDGLIMADFENFSVQNLIPAIFLTFVSAISTVMLAVILSQAYVRAEEKLPPPPTDEKPNDIQQADKDPVTANSGSWTGN